MAVIGNEAGMSMADDQQQIAEGIDPDELGDDPAGDLSYPPEVLQGADDPTRDDHVIDSVSERAAREVDEQGLEEDSADGMRLVAPTDPYADDEAEAVASAVEDTGDLSAEEAAIHVISEPEFG